MEIWGDRSGHWGDMSGHWGDRSGHWGERVEIGRKYIVDWGERVEIVGVKVYLRDNGRRQCGLHINSVLHQRRQRGHL